MRVRLFKTRAEGVKKLVIIKKNKNKKAGRQEGMKGIVILVTKSLCNIRESKKNQTQAACYKVYTNVFKTVKALGEVYNEIETNVFTISLFEIF